MEQSTLRTTLIACATLTAAARAVPPNNYRVDVIGMGMTSYDMNDSGTIVGRQMNLLGVGRAFVAARGTASQLLPLPAPWQSSDAYAISPNGIIAGAVSSGSIASVGSRAAAWYPNGSGYDFVLLPPIAGDTYSAAFGVNSAGDIVGGSGGLGLGSYPRAARFTPKAAIALNGIGTPADINESRVVVSGNQLLDLDTMAIETIPLPPGNWQGFIAVDISNAGNICGSILGFSGCSTFPLRYLPGTGWQFVGGCATTTSANSVNDFGDATAYVANTSVWISFAGEENASPESILAPSQGSWLISGVGTISNRREVTAIGRRVGETANQLLRLRPYAPEDLDDNGAVDGRDLTVLLSAWGDFGGAADLNGDGIVSSADLTMLLSAWSG